jgi:hypothetical protein
MGTNLGVLQNKEAATLCSEAKRRGHTQCDSFDFEQKKKKENKMHVVLQPDIE